MKAKPKLKWTLDVLMTIALLFLMGYQFWGEAAHEWIGGRGQDAFLESMAEAGKSVVDYLDGNISW